MKKNKGDIKIPKETCNDKNCPYHGHLKVKGRSIKAIVRSAKMHKSVTAEWKRIEYIPKYERYLKKTSKISAHLPECIKANSGDLVLIRACRPLSKTINHVVVENLGDANLVLLEKETKYEGKDVRGKKPLVDELEEVEEQVKEEKVDDNIEDLNTDSEEDNESIKE